MSTNGSDTATSAAPGSSNTAPSPARVTTPITTPHAGTAMKHVAKSILLLLVIVGFLGGGAYAWWRSREAGPPPGFVTGNGRLEATEINVSAKLAGRVVEMLVDEGDFVEAGAPLVYMQTDVLVAQRAEAVAQFHQAREAVATARSNLAMREADLAASQALILQRESELRFAQRTLARIEKADEQSAVSVHELDVRRTERLVAEATLTAAKAQAAAAESAIEAARAEILGAESTVVAREASVERIQADIKDSVLYSPRDGRVQYRIAQPGEVLSAGGRALNVVDLGDVYMTFFLPDAVAGRVTMGTEVRLVLDAAPDLVIPAEVSFVASVAQFTPKSVETATERQKLMFRVKARISPDLLRQHLHKVKTGLPGVAWVRIDPSASWPESLAIRLPKETDHQAVGSEPAKQVENRP